MNGILIINKEIGYTSRDVVNIISKTFNTKKVGHTGTLDPSCSGVLVTCIGNALKMCELLTNHDKEYVAEVVLGTETDTLDMDGKVLKDTDVYIEKEKIIDVVNSFETEYDQVVPKYSSVKVNGKKLYEYARNNIDVILPSRKVKIKKIEIIDDIIYDDGKINFKFRCTVSKGTYIRSLIRDIGEKLGTVAVMKSLIRTRQGNFTLDNSFTLEEIQNENYKLISIMEAFPEIPRIVVDDSVAFKVKNGMILDKFFDSPMAFILDKDNNLISLYKNDGEKCRTYRMF